MPEEACPLGELDSNEAALELESVTEPGTVELASELVPGVTIERKLVGTRTVEAGADSEEESEVASTELNVDKPEPVTTEPEVPPDGADPPFDVGLAVDDIDPPTDGPEAELESADTAVEGPVMGVEVPMLDESTTDPVLSAIDDEVELRIGGPGYDGAEPPLVSEVVV